MSTRTLTLLACVAALLVGAPAQAQTDAPEAAPPTEDNPELGLIEEAPPEAEEEEEEAPPPVALSFDGEPIDDMDDGAGDDAPTPMASRADLGLVIGGKVGGALGTGAVGATPVFELELGYALPPLNRAIEIFVAGQYSQPGTDGTISEPDMRLPDDGSFSYDITQQILTVTLGGIYRIDLQNDLLMPYGGLGGRLYLLNTKTKGESGGETFGESEETQTDFGLVVMGGVDIFLGPGALLAELSFGWAAVDGFVLRDTNLGALSLAVGYRVIL